MSVIFPHFFFEIFKFLLAQLFIKNKIEKFRISSPIINWKKVVSRTRTSKLNFMSEMRSSL